MRCFERKRFGFTLIIFVTGQYAGAQYIHPILKKWDAIGALAPEYTLVATGSSELYWKENNIKYEQFTEKNDDVILSYLKTKNPNFIFLSASGTEELEYIFILQARKLGIETANFIDTWTNYKGRYAYNGKSVYPDKIISINEKCTEEMVKDGIPSDKIYEIGQPYLEEVCKAIPSLGTQILLPIQPIKKHWGNKLGYDETTFLNTVIPLVEQVDKTLHLNITQHPDSVATYPKAGITISESQGLLDIKNCHTVLGMFSSQMILGYLWGRNILSIQPNLKTTDPSPLSRWGFIPRIGNKEELSEFFNLNPIDTITERSVLLNQIDGSLNRLDNFLRRKS